MAKVIFSFDDKSAKKLKNKKNILGGKGANLGEMGRLGLPVPPGFTITTDVCDLFYKNKKKLSTKIIKNIEIFVKKFERVCLGVSNKRFSSKIFSQLKDKDLHIASLAITAFATYKGVMFLRVHNVSANSDALEVAWKTHQST